MFDLRRVSTHEDGEVLESTGTACRNQLWFALQVKPRYEKATAHALRAKGFEEFLPLHRVHRRWSDRSKELEEPFFPGYVFCRFHPGNRLPVMVTPGVRSIIGIGKTPVPVEDAEIAALRMVVESGRRTEVCPFLNVGQRIRIEGGSLTGLEGILVAVKSSSRVVVSVTLLQRSIAVEIDPEWVYPVDGTRVPPQSASACRSALVA